MLDKLVPGGFNHHEQSLRVADLLADNGKGLNLTLWTRDGILKHSKGLGPVFAPDPERHPGTGEGMTVRVSDIVAYLAHDMDDAMEAGILTVREIPVRILRVFGDSPESRENAMLRDLVENTEITPEGLKFSFSPGMEENMETLREFLLAKVYRDSAIMSDMTEGAMAVKRIYERIMADDELFETLPLRHLASDRAEAVKDFIAGMTDNFCFDYLEKLR